MGKGGFDCEIAVLEALPFAAPIKAIIQTQYEGRLGRHSSMNFFGGENCSFQMFLLRSRGTDGISVMLGDRN